MYGGRDHYPVRKARLLCPCLSSFAIEAVPVTYTIGTASGGAQRAGELIVRG